MRQETSARADRPRPVAGATAVDEAEPDLSSEPCRGGLSGLVEDGGELQFGQRADTRRPQAW